MSYSPYQLLWFFLLYSFAGWCAGVATGGLRNKKFINTGFLNAPLCPVYGFGALACTVFLADLHQRLFFLFVGGIIISAVVTYLTGFMLERIFHMRWWDFTRHRFQFEGYISLPFIAICGLASVLCVRIANPLAAGLLRLIPLGIGRIVLLVIYALLAIDFIGAAAAVLQLRSRVKHFVEATEETAGSLMENMSDNVTENLQRLSDTFGNAITRRMQRRMANAYPNLRTERLLAVKRQERTKAETEGVFAAGCCFYKLVVLFFIGAFLGDIVETIFCYATAGVWMSRSSVVYGPFSIVWGLGCVLLTGILYKYKDKNDRYIFVFGTILGGAYEYLCSVFTELVFGTIFWDYSGIPFNLGGRINLLYCFFWGVAAVVWLKGIYPFLSARIERLPLRAATVGTWIFIVFMVFNMGISSLAMARYSIRQVEEKPASNEVESFLDEHFPDSRMERIYPNAKIVVG